MAISKNAISRLPLYRTALLRLKDYGAQKVYSCDIAGTIGITAAQVRKDFSAFQFFGKKKVGYSVNQLVKNIDEILRKNDPPRAVLCGSGPGLEFLLHEFDKTAGAAFVIAAAFDTSGVNTVCREKCVEIPFLGLATMTNYVSKNGIKFGIIAASDTLAQSLLDMLILGGVRGVLSLSNTELKCPKSCVVHSIHIRREIERIIYHVNNPPIPERAGVQ